MCICGVWRRVFVASSKGRRVCRMLNVEKDKKQQTAAVVAGGPGVLFCGGLGSRSVLGCGREGLS